MESQIGRQLIELLRVQIVEREAEGQKEEGVIRMVQHLEESYREKVESSEQRPNKQWNLLVDEMSGSVELKQLNKVKQYLLFSANTYVQDNCSGF